MKMFLGIASCGVALLAQFYPAKFPDSYAFLVACVTTYVILNAALTLYVTYVEKGTILFTKPKVGGAPATDSGLALRSKMARFSEDVVFTVMRHDTQDPKHPSAVEATVNVCDYVYEDGVLAEEKFQQAVKALVLEFEAGKGEGSKKTK